MGTGEQYLRGGHIVRYPGHVNALLVMRVLLVLALCLCSQAGIAQMFEDPTVGLSVTTDSVTENAPSGVEVSVRASRAGAGSSREEDLSTSVALAQSTVSGICGRTPQVRDGLLAVVQAKDADAADCSQVTTAHLQALTGTMDLSNRGITSLRSGDMTGLTNLATMFLSGNALTGLPDGIFASLTSLEELYLYGNDLRMLPDGIFDGFASLRNLNLNDNDLRTLPDGVFEGLANLSALFLGDNPGTASFRPGADAGTDRNAVSGTTVGLDGSASGGGPWGTNITHAWVVADGLGNPVSDLTLTGEDASTPSFITPETVPGGELVFTLTVQGAGNVLYKSTASVRVAIRAAPVVTSVALVSVPTNGTTYNNGERIEVAVTFQEPARVIVSGGTPSIGLTVGTAAKTAGYLRGSGGVNLVFAYEVRASDTDTDGVSVPANSLARNGGRIVNPDGLEFRLTHDGLSDDTGHRVNGTGSPPTGGVCGRTPEVRAALLTRVQANHANVADCSQVTTARLQALTGTLHLGRKGIVDLQSGDFADLTSLGTLDLLGNDLETLPEGLFQGLASLETLSLDRIFELSPACIPVSTTLEYPLSLISHACGALTRR